MQIQCFPIYFYSQSDITFIAKLENATLWRVDSLSYSEFGVLACYGDDWLGASNDSLVYLGVYEVLGMGQIPQ